jgi:hypothetical protein
MRGFRWGQPASEHHTRNDQDQPVTEYTEQGQREIDLPARDAYAAVIDHVIACCQGRDRSRLSPASVLDTLQLTLEVRAALTAPKRP